MIPMETVVSTAAEVETPSEASGAITPADSVVRVERGQADPEELAALTAILLARAGRSGEGIGEGGRTPARSTARWRRLERTPGFRAPHSWQG